MSRYARRISRPLIAALGLTIAIGAAVYYFKNHKPRSASAHTGIPPVVASPAKAASNAMPVSAGSLVEGRSEKEAGHLLTARELINNALLSGQLGDADLDAARQMLSEINQDMLFSPRQIPGDPYTDTYAVQ